MTMLEMLGELYNGQGMFGDAIKVYRQLMAIAPNDVKVCSWQNETLKNVLSMTGAKASPEAVKELQRLSQVYDKFKDDKRLKGEQLEECKDSTANTLRELATVWHKEAQKTNDNNTYALAQYLYKEYLSKFPKEKDAYIMTWYSPSSSSSSAPTATTRSSAKPAPSTPRSWSWILRQGQVSARSRLRRRDLLEELPLRRGVKEDQVEQQAEEARRGQGQERRGEGKGVRAQAHPRPPAEDARGLRQPTSVCARRAGAAAHQVQQGPRLLRSQPLRRGGAALQGHRLQPPGLGSGDLPANLYLDCLAVQKKYRDLETTVQDFLDQPKLSEKDPAFKQQLSVIKVGTMRKHIEELEKANKYKAAADLYIQLATRLSRRPQDRRGSITTRRSCSRRPSWSVSPSARAASSSRSSPTRRWPRRRST